VVYIGGLLACAGGLLACAGALVALRLWSYANAIGLVEMGSIPVSIVTETMAIAILIGFIGGDEAWGVAEKGVPTAPVIIDGRLLFRVRGVTAFPATQRARAIGDRIRTLARDETQPVSALHLVEAEHSTGILAGDQFIMSVFNADARIERGGLARRVIAGVQLKLFDPPLSDTLGQGESVLSDKGRVS
jgi:hypothetical protein